MRVKRAKLLYPGLIVAVMAGAYHLRGNTDSTGLEPQAVAIGTDNGQESPTNHVSAPIPATLPLSAIEPPATVNEGGAEQLAAPGTPQGDQQLVELYARLAGQVSTVESRKRTLRLFGRHPDPVAGERLIIDVLKSEDPDLESAACCIEAGIQLRGIFAKRPERLALAVAELSATANEGARYALVVATIRYKPPGGADAYMTAFFTTNRNSVAWITLANVGNYGEASSTMAMAADALGVSGLPRYKDLGTAAIGAIRSLVRHQPALAGQAAELLIKAAALPELTLDRALHLTRALNEIAPRRDAELMDVVGANHAGYPPRIRALERR